jgi:glycosyltransferase involved in cell wall biosynthesis
LEKTTTIRRLKGGRARDSAGGGHSCLIVHHSTFGMRNDAAVLARAIRRRIPDYEVFAWELPLPVSKPRDAGLLDPLPKGLERFLPFDFVVFIEHIRPVARIWDPEFARRVVFIPNVEWFMPYDDEAVRENGIDTVLYKNAFSAQIGASIPVLAAIADRRVIGWTSEDLRPDGDVDGMDYDLALHLQGLSRQKQSETLLATWLGRPHFPRLVSIASTNCGLKLPAPADMAPNIRIVLGAMADDGLRRMQRAHGIHVYPSAAEGFGLALDEARSAGAVLVTTDGAPMNDLVEDGVSGILVPVREGNSFAFGRSRGFKVEEDDVGAAVERVLALSMQERRAMGLRARARYLEQRDDFHAAVGDFVTDSA